MKVSVMQPYAFPYLGYFQLINAVDVFVFYDDVNFIKQGWINRNKILVNGKENLFTIPIRNISSFRPINETEINSQLYQKWKTKFLKSLAQAYKKAPHYEVVFSIVERVLEKEHDSISALAIDSIEVISSYLKLDTKFVLSSEQLGGTKGLDKADRLIEIMSILESKQYINPAGGADLYERDYFMKDGVSLQFISNTLPTYPQADNEFVNGLSIIDVLMWNSKEEVNEMLNKYTLT